MCRVGSVWVCRRGTGFGQGQDKLRVAMGGYGEAGDGCSRGADLGAQILDMDNIRNISRIWRLLRHVPKKKFLKCASVLYS